MKSFVAVPRTASHQVCGIPTLPRGADQREGKDLALRILLSPNMTHDLPDNRIFGLTNSSIAEL